jgi:mannose-6-phosphate isomerase-like protein (cupin superfamily)
VKRALAALLLVACARPAPPPSTGAEAVLDALYGSERRTVALDALAEDDGLAPAEAFKVVELGRDAHTSHHLVWIRDREVPHRHDRHDLVVVMLRGHGAMRLGAEERAVGEGSILYVPRGSVHAFRNASPEPAAAYAVYTPAFDGADRVPVE